MMVGEVTHKEAAHMASRNKMWQEKRADKKDLPKVLA
jgi:hypothetical protein